VPGGSLPSGINRSSNRMRRILSALLCPLLCLVMPVAFAQAPGPLLEPADLAGLLTQPNVRVIDIREGGTTQGKTLYEDGHIPGAIDAPYRFWRGPETAPGRMRDQDYLGELVQRLGVERDTLAVVVFEGRDFTDFGAAARVYWTLRYIGVEHAAILHTRIATWRPPGQP